MITIRVASACGWRAAEPSLASMAQTDDFSFNVVEGKLHVHDLHATILHLVGIDHERLTYRHQGRAFRLTDVHGHVVDDILNS